MPKALRLVCHWGQLVTFFVLGLFVSLQAESSTESPESTTLSPEHLAPSSHECANQLDPAKFEIVEDWRITGFSSKVALFPKGQAAELLRVRNTLVRHGIPVAMILDPSLEDRKLLLESDPRFIYGPSAVTWLAPAKSMKETMWSKESQDRFSTRPFGLRNYNEDWGRKLNRAPKFGLQTRFEALDREKLLSYYHELYLPFMVSFRSGADNIQGDKFWEKRQAKIDRGVSYYVLSVYGYPTEAEAQDASTPPIRLGGYLLELDPTRSRLTVDKSAFAQNKYPETAKANLTIFAYEEVIRLATEKFQVRELGYGTDAAGYAVDLKEYILLGLARTKGIFGLSPYFEPGEWDGPAQTRIFGILDHSQLHFEMSWDNSVVPHKYLSFGFPNNDAPEDNGTLVSSSVVGHFFGGAESDGIKYLETPVYYRSIDGITKRLEGTTK